MNMKLNSKKLTCFIALLLVMSTLGFFIPAVPAPIMTKATSGEIGGVLYEYQEETDSASSSGSFSESFSESVSNTTTDSYSTDMMILTGMEYQDTIWSLYVNKSMADPKSTWTHEADKFNSTGIFGVWFRYANYEQWKSGNYFSQKIYGLAEDTGWLEPPGWKTEYAILTEVNDTTVEKRDIFQTPYGTETVTNYQVDYYDNNDTEGDTSDDFIVFQELLIVNYILVKANWESVAVDVETTTTTSTSITGDYNFTGSYTWTRNGYQVRIEDPSDFVFNYYAVKNFTVDYEYEGGWTIDGSVSIVNDVEVRNASNGNLIPEDVRPFWAKSMNLTSSGRWSTTFEQEGTSHSVAALEGIIELIHTRETVNATNLAIWASWRPGYQIGYFDLDENDMLNGNLVNGSLEVIDEIMALGIPEGTHLSGDSVVDSYVSASVYSSLGNDVLVDESIDESAHVDESFEYIRGFDPEEADVTVNFDWTEPVYNEATDEVTFAWETTYDDMPVRWWTTNGTYELLIMEEQDLSYGYELVVNPVEGEADLSTTYTTTAVTNNTLLSRLDDLQMATIRKDAFLSITALEDEFTGAWMEEWDETDITVGGHPLLEMDFSKTKGTYTLTNSSGPYESHTAVLNVLTAWGSTSGPTNRTDYNEFTSNFNNDLANALIAASAEDFDGTATWILTEDIITTSYPVWEGQGIIHDPKIRTYYKPTTQTTTSPPPSTTTPPTETTTWDTSVSFPAFGFLAFLLTVPIVVLVIQRKRRK